MPPRGREHSKVFYKGGNDDYIIFVDDIPAYQRWKNDKTIPLSRVVSGWGIYVSHQQGAQGILDSASNARLVEEFGTSKEEDVVKFILENGDVQEGENPERVGIRNETMGPRADHS